MSFIQKDFSLLNELIKIALVGDEVPFREGEPETLNATVLSGLVNKLENDLYVAPSLPDTSQFSSERPNTQLFPSDLFNPDNFMKFLTRNKITMNGIRLAYDHNGADDVLYSQLSPSAKSEYFPYPNPNEFNFYANGRAIKAFLAEQLTQATQRKDNFQPALIKKLSDQIQTLAGQDVNPVPKTPSTQAPPTTTTTTQDNKQETTPGQSGAPSEAQSKLLENVVRYMPFRDMLVNLDAINTFLKQYENLFASSEERSSALLSSTQTIRADMDTLKNMSDSVPTINTGNFNTDAGTILSRLRNRGDFNSYMMLLRKIVSDTQTIFSNFKESYRERLQQNGYLGLVNANINMGTKNIRDINAILTYGKNTVKGAV